jgi:hypothetical protein
MTLLWNAVTIRLFLFCFSIESILRVFLCTRARMRVNVRVRERVRSKQYYFHVREVSRENV